MTDVKLDLPDRPARPVTPLADYLDRYEKLAVHRVFDGPRYRMSYVTVGEGPARIFCVPGICSHRQFFAPLSVELADEFQVVAYDLPGINDGDGARLDRYSLDDYAADLVALADRLGERRIMAMGFSFGSTTTIRAMSRFAERAPRAMLIGGFVHRPLAPFERLVMKSLRRAPGRLAWIPGMKAASRYNHGVELEAREKGLTEFLVQNVGKTPTATAARQALAVSATDLRDVVSRLEQPVFVFHGENDRLVPVRHAAELANRIRNVRVMVVPRCGHVPQLSHPELLARVAREFFSASDASLELQGYGACCGAAGTCDNPISPQALAANDPQ